jgi:hypothetical protein
MSRIDGRYKANRNGCWIWTGRKNDSGYGTFGRALAHRLSYEEHVGPIPAGMVVMHLCDTPLCVNPAHLRAATRQENIRDMWEKGRGTNNPRAGEAHPMRKLDAAAVRDIRAAAASGQLQREIAARYGVGREVVSSIVRGATWGSVA